MTKKKQFIRLYENCEITIGHNRSLIVDVQRTAYYAIPNSLALLFNDNVLDIDFDLFDEDERETMEEYCNFLIENELGFHCEENLLSNFIRKSVEWDYPALITNAIFEVDYATFLERYRHIEGIIDSCLTRHIEVCFINPVDIEQLKTVLKNLDALDLNNYNIIFSLKDNEFIEEALKLLNQHYKIYRTILFNAPERKIIETKKAGWGNIFVVDYKFTYKYCGIVDSNYFTISTEHFTESLKFNTCLNRKLAIDIDGNVRNCPNTKVVHGNINDGNIVELMKAESFARIGKIHKGLISVCKDCEFRNICTDCRAFLENPEDIFSKPLKCGYDPYTNQWTDWADSQLKKSLIEYYLL